MEPGRKIISFETVRLIGGSRVWYIVRGPAILPTYYGMTEIRYSVQNSWLADLGTDGSPMGRAGWLADLGTDGSPMGRAGRHGRGVPVQAFLEQYWGAESSPLTGMGHP